MHNLHYIRLRNMKKDRCQETELRYLEEQKYEDSSDVNPSKTCEETLRVYFTSEKQIEVQ